MPPGDNPIAVNKYYHYYYYLSQNVHDGLQYVRANY